MDDRNVILLLGFFESAFDVDIHELIMTAVRMSFSLQFHVQKWSSESQIFPGLWNSVTVRREGKQASLEEAAWETTVTMKNQLKKRR